MIKQHEMNAEYGGIHPLQAQKLHAVNVVRILIDVAPGIVLIRGSLELSLRR